MRVAASCLGVVLVAGACAHEGGDPSSVPIEPITDDAVFVVNGGDNTITVIDAVTDEVAGTIDLINVSYPHHIYLSADASTLVVAVPGSDLSGGHGSGGGHGGAHGATGGAVLALDARTGAVKAARRLDAPNHNALFAPGGTTIWTSQIVEPPGANRALWFGASSRRATLTAPVLESRASTAPPVAP